jgi:hypothetical protein
LERVNLILEDVKQELQRGREHLLPHVVQPTRLAAAIATVNLAGDMILGHHAAPLT